MLSTARSCTSVAVATVSLMLGGLASASVVIPGAPVDPVADTFGAIPAATFGGSGIPNTAMAISTVVDAGNTITLGIAATPRFSGTNVSNDGMGSYVVAAGDGDPGLAKWNFSFYTNIADGAGSFADYRFEVGYDLDSTDGNALGTLGTIDLNASIFDTAEAGAPGSGPLALAATTTAESSQNLAFGYLTTGIPGSVTPPSPLPSFSTDSRGEYVFQIRVYDSLVGGTLLDQVSIAVNAVPEPTAVLFGSLLAGGLGLTVARRRSEED